MATFAEVKADLLAEVLNSHSSTEGKLAKAMVRTLQSLQPEAVPFMEVSGSFTTQNGVASYSHQTGAANFPRNLLAFERLWYDLGASPQWLFVVGIEEVRWFQEQPAVAYPVRVAWYEKQLHFGPAPAGSYAVKWDGFRDSTLDMDGEAITDTSTTASNPWLNEGLVCFKHLALADYYMTDPASARPDMASNHAQLGQMQLTRLREAQKRRRDVGSSPQVPNAFSAYLYPDDRAARISILHPGAPV